MMESLSGVITLKNDVFGWSPVFLNTTASAFLLLFLSDRQYFLLSSRLESLIKLKSGYVGIEAKHSSRSSEFGTIGLSGKRKLASSWNFYFASFTALVSGILLE
jgi:hypothetical protein